MLTQFANAHRGKGSPTLSPERFNPFAKTVPVKKRTATDEDLRILFGD